MPLPANTQIVECTVWATIDKQRVLNVYHYYADPGSFAETLATMNSIATDFLALTVTLATYKAAFSTATEFNQVTAQVVYPNRVARGVAQVVPAVPGTRAGTPMPSSTQASVTTQSDLPGAGGHGGNRYAGLTITDVNASNVTGAYIADLFVAVDALYKNLTLAGKAVKPLIYNRNFPLNSNPVVSNVYETQARTMRRRVVGRGI